MLPTSREIAMQIAVFHELYPKETISELAARMMYSPVFIINALDEGEKMELFSRVKDKDKLIATTPVDYATMMGLEFGQEQTRIQNEILRAVASANADQNDVEEGTLQLWLRGIRPGDVELALHVLQKIDFIAKYEIANPKELKSKYTFYTLRINEGKNWGLKQFKEVNTKKKK